MAGHNRLDLAGVRFGRLIAMAYSHTNKNRKAVWICMCECGRSNAVMAMRLRSGHTTSCGCAQLESRLKNMASGNLINAKHLRIGTRTYRSWAAMKQRCFNVKNHNYRLYGGRGISVCYRWTVSFASFLSDMGQRPIGMTIERLDRDGNYEPENCVWATPKQQANNRSNSIYVDVFGAVMSIGDAAVYCGNVSPSTARDRLGRGWSADDAVFTPNGKRREMAEVPF